MVRLEPAGVDAVGDDASAAARQHGETPEQPSAGFALARQADVVSDDEHGVEHAQALVDVCQGERSRVADAAPPGDFDR